MPPEQQERKKRVYEKPRLRVIELAADEVLGIGCKLVSGGSASGATPCWANSCGQAGS